MQSSVRRHQALLNISSDGRHTYMSRIDNREVPKSESFCTTPPQGESLQLKLDKLRVLANSLSDIESQATGLFLADFVQELLINNCPNTDVFRIGPFDLIPVTGFKPNPKRRKIVCKEVYENPDCPLDLIVVELGGETFCWLDPANHGSRDDSHLLAIGDHTKTEAWGAEDTEVIWVDVYWAFVHSLKQAGEPRQAAFFRLITQGEEENKCEEMEAMAITTGSNRGVHGWNQIFFLGRKVCIVLLILALQLGICPAHLQDKEGSRIAVTYAGVITNGAGGNSMKVARVLWGGTPVLGPPITVMEGAKAAQAGAQAAQLMGESMSNAAVESSLEAVLSAAGDIHFTQETVTGMAIEVQYELQAAIDAEQQQQQQQQQQQGSAGSQVDS